MMTLFKQALLPLIIYLAGSKVYCQTEIIYDYCKGTYQDKIKPVRTGDFVFLKIINLNTFRYKAEIKGKSIDYVTPIPSELQALFRLPSGSNMQQDAQEGVSKAEEGKEQLQQFALKVEAQTDKSKAKLGELREDIAKSTKTKKTKESERALSEALSALQAKENEDEILQHFSNTIKELLKASQNYVLLAKKVAAIKITRADLIDISKQDWCGQSELHERMPTPLPYEAMKKDFLDFYSHYATINAQYHEALIAANATDIQSNKDLVENVFKLVKTSYDKLNEENFLELIRDIGILQEGLERNGSFQVVSPPIQMDGDYVRFEVSSTPIKVNDLMNISQGKSFYLEIPTRGGWKADFSVGPAFSIGKNARDDKYFLRNETDTTSILVKSNNRSAIFPAVVAMFHAYPRSGSQANIGIMMGVGAGYKAGDELSASYYIGPTLVLGKYQKTMFSLGASFLQVSRLKSIYTENSFYESSLSLDNVTEKVIKSAFFFAISYNLTNRVEVK